MILSVFWLWVGEYKIEELIDCFLSWPSEADQSVVGTVTSLQVQETRGEIVRVTWVGVQGATAYRVSWRRMDGRYIAGPFYFCDQILSYSSVMDVLWQLVCVTLLTVATMWCCRWWREESAGGGRCDSSGFRPVGPRSPVRGAGHGFSSKQRGNPCVCQSHHTWVLSSYIQT